MLLVITFLTLILFVLLALLLAKNVRYHVYDDCQVRGKPYLLLQRAHFSIAGRCWPQIHKECFPFIKRCKVMAAKFLYFKSSNRSFIDCIPAAGEAVRLRWCCKRHTKRKKVILSLKSANKTWKRTSFSLKSVWQMCRHEQNASALQQLCHIRSFELSMYNSVEIKWLQKNYRILAKRMSLRETVEQCENNSVLSANGEPVLLDPLELLT